MSTQITAGGRGQFFSYSHWVSLWSHRLVSFSWCSHFLLPLVSLLYSFLPVPRPPLRVPTPSGGTQVSGRWKWSPGSWFQPSGPLSLHKRVYDSGVLLCQRSIPIRDGGPSEGWASATQTVPVLYEHYNNIHLSMAVQQSISITLKDQSYLCSGCFGEG